MTLTVIFFKIFFIPGHCLVKLNNTIKRQDNYYFKFYSIDTYKWKQDD